MTGQNYFSKLVWKIRSSFFYSYTFNSLKKYWNVLGWLQKWLIVKNTKKVWKYPLKKSDFIKNNVIYVNSEKCVLRITNYFNYIFRLIVKITSECWQKPKMADFWFVEPTHTIPNVDTILIMRHILLLIVNFQAKDFAPMIPGITLHLYMQVRFLTSFFFLF